MLLKARLEVIDLKGVEEEGGWDAFLGLPLPPAGPGWKEHKSGTHCAGACSAQVGA